ncbi:MAG: hypothetical protein IJP90_11200 [Treponema sp.]|nr:hypothetical protein [Treponema sp.]
MNGVSEDRLPEVFDKGDYQVLLVANKYQVGYDQPKLCAMYVLKKLRDVAAVQTLSRLNRVYPPFKKKTFVLDFVNDYATIQKAFSRYYTATFLANSITPKQVYELEAKIDGYFIIDPADIDSFNTLLLKNKAAAKDKKEIAYYLGRAKNKVEQLDQKGQQEFMLLLRHFIRFYEFLIQATCFEDIELHKKYKFIDCLYSFIGIKSSGGGFNLDGMVKATSFVQKKSSVHKDEKIHADPYIKLPTAEDFGLSPEKEQRLSEIIRDINSRTGKAFDSDVATKAMLQIKDILLKDERLKSSAKTNSLKDFEFSFYDGINNALVEGWSQNQDFFTLLLDNENIKKEVLGIFFEEIYRSLRASDEEG